MCVICKNWIDLTLIGIVRTGTMGGLSDYEYCINFLSDCYEMFVL